MWEDDELRAAVLAELDTAPPASGGGLGEVVRRGRRRRRVRHAGTALAVVALLTATGAAATALSGDPLPPATPAPPSEVSWPRVDLPWQTPIGIWEGPPPATPPTGDERVAPYPLCDVPAVIHDRTDVHEAPYYLRAGIMSSVRAAAPDARAAGLERDYEVPDRAAYVYQVDLTDAEGTGSLRFSLGDYAGTPLAAADAQAFDVGNCAPPKRRVLTDGTVLQLYEMRPSRPSQSLTQELRIFLPDGRLFQLVVQNWAGGDREPSPGRATLPLTEGQLARIAVAIAR